MHFDASETATVLAALRLFQKEFRDCEAKDIYDHFPDHFLSGDRMLEPLGTEDINELCERISFAE